jgi:hypothetical protein
MLKFVVVLVGIFAFSATASAQLNPYGNSSNIPRLYAPNGQFLGNL